MAEIEKQTRATYGESDDSFALLWVAVPICAMIVATGALYLGRPVLLPLAIALILSVVFSPIATRLEPYFGRLVSAALVVLVAIGVITATGYFLTIELTSGRRPGRWTIPTTSETNWRRSKKPHRHGSSISRKRSPTFSVA